jgi:hypothetical protein
VIYKVIAKILVGHLAHVLSGIISPMQNAFLGGRLMSDNINLVKNFFGSLTGNNPPLVV